MTRKKIWIPLAALMLVVLGWLAWSTSIATPPGGPATGGAATEGTLSPDAEAVGAVLAALPEDPAAHLSRSSVIEGIDLSEAFPEGTRLVPRQHSWSPAGADEGLMEVEIVRPNAEPETYVAVMVHEEGRWRLLATVGDLDE